MRRVIVTEFLTLDGVMDAPHEWSFPYWNEEIGKFKFDEMFSTDAILLGRVTYEGFAAAWPSRTDEQGFADRINNLPKYVVSTTLQKAEWNNSKIIKGSVAEEVSKLREQSGGDIVVHGSGQLVQTLNQHDLVDVYRLLVYPLVRGRGKRLFPEGSEAKLKLMESRPFGSGVVAMVYAPESRAS